MHFDGFLDSREAIQTTKDALYASCKTLNYSKQNPKISDASYKIQRSVDHHQWSVRSPQKGRWRARLQNTAWRIGAHTSLNTWATLVSFKATIISHQYCFTCLPIFVGPFTVGEYQKAKNSIKLEKGVGPDEIPPKVLMLCNIDEQIMYLRNNVLEKRETPAQWSLLNITPIPKPVEWAQQVSLAVEEQYPDVSLSLNDNKYLQFNKTRNSFNLQLVNDV